MLNISQEMNALKAMVTDLVRGQNFAKAPHVPQDLFDYYQQLIENQVADELALDVVTTLQKNLRPEHLSQPNFVAEQFTGRPGKYVSLPDTIRSFREILDGKHDDLPEQAFYSVGTIDQAVAKAERMRAEG